MFQPESYLPVLSLMILSMLCWGSWANTMKLCLGYQFQLFYWDYVWGMIAGALLWGFTLDNIGSEGRGFFADLSQVNAAHIGFALVGGVLFNIANLLLVAAIEIAGLAVAFPVGIGLALVVGAISSYILLPNGNPLLLFGGIALVIAAIIFDAIAYRLRETERRSLSARGVIISLIAGLLMGGFYPFVARAMSGPGAGCPYAITFVFVLGVLVCAIPFNLLLMHKPLDGSSPLLLSEYMAARRSWHLWGLLGGVIWCTGALFNFVSSRAHAVGPAGLLFHRTRSDHDFCSLGRFRLEGICCGAGALKEISHLDVHPFSGRTLRYCARPGHLEIGSYQEGAMSAGNKPVAVVGSINIDLVTNTKRIPIRGETIDGSEFQIHPGGKGANQAVAVARLGYPVRMIGRIGDDAFGLQLRTQLEQAGVNVAGIITTPGSSGVATIIVADNGENCIVITPGANALLVPEDIDANLEIIRSSGVVLTQLEIPLETVEYLAGICTREGIPLILDPAPAKELPASLLKAVSWFTPNETEAAFFTGENGLGLTLPEPVHIAKAMIQRAIQGVILKLGSRGAFLASKATLEEQLPAFAVQAIDTTAAGDAFNGAFAVGLLLGKDPVSSARFATAAAALSVTRAGAQPSMPTIDEVDRLLQSRQEAEDTTG